MPTLDPVALAALPIGTANAQAYAHNAGALDTVVNGIGVVPSRTGKQLLSIDEAMRRIGYEAPVAFASGISVTRGTQTVVNAGVTYHANPASLPFTTTGTFSPAQWLLVSNVSAQDLASTASGKGAALVGNGVISVSTLVDLRAVLKTSAAKRALVAGFGDYYLDAADTTTVDNGATVIVAADGGRWKLATGNIEPVLTATEGVTFANGYRVAASGHLDVPTSNPGNVRYWAANYSVRIPAGATIPAGDVRHDHVGVSGRAWSESINSRIWGLVGLVHVTSPATTNAQIGQALGSELDVNNNTGYDVNNLNGDGDVGGQLVATGGTNVLKFGWCLSKIAAAVGRFFTGIWFRQDSLAHDGFGIYFGNVSPSVGIRFGDDYTGGPALQTNPAQDALYMRTTSGPYARVRSELDRLVINCGSGGMYIANAANTDNLFFLSNAGALGAKVTRQGLTAPMKTSSATSIDASTSSVIICSDAAATTVTAINNGVDLQKLTIVALTGNTTIQHNASIKMRAGANYTLGALTTMTLLSVGGTWYET